MFKLKIILKKQFFQFLHTAKLFKAFDHQTVINLSAGHKIHCTITTTDSQIEQNNTKKAYIVSTPVVEYTYNPLKEKLSVKSMAMINGQLSP